MKYFAIGNRPLSWMMSVATSLVLAACGGGGAGTTPAGVQEFKSVIDADHNVSLVWSIPNTVAYNVYCSETSPVDLTAATTDITAATTTTTTIKYVNAISPFQPKIVPASGTLYCVVTSIGAAVVESAPSAPLRITFPPPAPNSVVAEAIPGELQLTWTAVPNVSGYQIYVFDKTDTAFSSAALKLSSDIPTYTLTDLTPGATYRFVVTALVKDGDVTRESIASTITSQIPMAPVVPLNAENSSPTKDAADIDVTTLKAISVTFNRPLRAATVTPQTLTVRSPTGNVSGEVALDVSGLIAKFTPFDTLAPNTSFTVTVNKGIKDSLGVRLLDDYTFSFTTATTNPAGTPEQPPKVVETSPNDNQNNVDPPKNILVSFNKPMAEATINSGTLTVTRPGGTEVAGVVTLNQGGTTATFTPTSPLVANLQYAINISTNVKSSAGLPLGAAKVFHFTTKLPTLNVSDVAMGEDAGTASMALTLDLASGSPVTVDFATLNDTATAPNDFVSTGGTVTFAPGETGKTIVISIVDDTTHETNEIFKVDLTNVSGATLVKSPGIVTVNDNDPATPAPLPLCIWDESNWDECVAQ